MDDLTDDGKGIGICHVIYRHEGFEDAARKLCADCQARRWLVHVWSAEW